jgi:hypothetical protein
MELGSIKLALALTRKRTTCTYVTTHFCKNHNYLVDKLHIDKCDLIKPWSGVVTDLIKPLEALDCIWDLDKV